jgi:uncharacterized protein (TIGR02118 family)
VIGYDHLRHDFSNNRKGAPMAAAKIVVLYPAPKDVAIFERDYTQDHAPMVTPRTFEGLTKFVATKVIGTPDGSPAPFYRIAELHFPSLAALQKAAGSAPAQQAVAHAFSISSGGKPIFLVTEEEVSSF